MLPVDTLAMSSLSAARLGIGGLAQIALFSLGAVILIHFLSRHEYDSTGYGVFGVIAISFISAGIGSAIGHEISGLAFLVLFCGGAGLLTAGPFLEFRFPHRLILGLILPMIYLMSALLGGFIEAWCERLN